MLLSLKVFFILFCSAAAVDGIELPGGCPHVPATHLLPRNLTQHQEIILGIPFTDPNKSYLFRNYNFTIAREFKIDLFNNVNALTISISVKDKWKYPYELSCRNALEDIHVLTDSIRLDCVISLNAADNKIDSACYPPFNLTVRTWVDGEFVIIWSCEEKLRIVHDEALIVVALHDSQVAKYLKQKKGYLEMMQKLNETARKYLNTPLLDMIQWTQEPDFSQPSVVVDPFPCSSDNLLTYSPNNNAHINISHIEIITLLAIALAITVFVVLMIWFAEKEN